MKKYYWYDTVSTTSFAGILAVAGTMTLMTILLLAVALLA